MKESKIYIDFDRVYSIIDDSKYRIHDKPKYDYRTEVITIGKSFDNFKAIMNKVKDIGEYYSKYDTDDIISEFYTDVMLIIKTNPEYGFGINIDKSSGKLIGLLQYNASFDSSTIDINYFDIFKCGIEIKGMKFHIPEIEIKIEREDDDFNFVKDLEKFEENDYIDDDTYIIEADPCRDNYGLGNEALLRNFEDIYFKFIDISKIRINSQRENLEDTLKSDLKRIIEVNSKYKFVIEKITRYAIVVNALLGREDNLDQSVRIGYGDDDKFLLNVLIKSPQVTRTYIEYPRAPNYLYEDISRIENAKSKFVKEYEEYLNSALKDKYHEEYSGKIMVNDIKYNAFGNLDINLTIMKE